MTRTEMLSALARTDRVTLEDFVLVAQAYMSAAPTSPQESLLFAAYIHGLATSLQPLIDDAIPTAPTEEVI